MASRFRYFTTAEEIKQCFLEVEKKRDLKYVKNERYLSTEVETYNSIADIPNLGINITGSQIGESYFVLDTKYDIVLHKVHEFDGITSYRIHESENKNAICLTFNGFYNDDCLIWNLVETMKDKNSEISYSLFKDITKQIKKISRKPESDFYITKGAEELYWNSNGNLRLIPMGWDEPKEYDIKLVRENE